MKRIQQRILATLLHYANASPPWNRTEFYALKERLLRQHGTFCGHDIQEITKECWGRREWDYRYREYNYLGCTKDERCSCRGTGVFDRRWIRLERWSWCGYVFHRPVDDTRIAPVDMHNELRAPDIIGRIEHPDYGDKSNEAVLWLYLLTGEWKLLWHALSSSKRHGRYWWPLMNVQRVTMPLVMRLRWRRCWCGRRYPTWGSGWQSCRRCRNKRREEVDIPF